MTPTPDNFEALEAYLDGTLDAAGRARIERELEANPPLRKLMAELAADRDLVANLPRASAPADLVETFQGQLERSALLGEAGEEDSDAAMQIHRWSHYASVAAVILLALGLGMVIYKVLPNREANQVAIATPPEKDGDVADVRRHEDALGSDALAERKKDAGENVAVIGGGGRGSTPTGGVAAATSSMQLKVDTLAKGSTVDRLPVTSDEVREMQQRLARITSAVPSSPLDLTKELQSNPAGPSAEEPIVLVVKAQDPRLANQDVSEFLRTNRLAYAVIAGNANGDLDLSNTRNRELKSQVPSTQPATQNTFGIANGGSLQNNGSNVANNIDANQFSNNATTTFANSFGYNNFSNRGGTNQAAGQNQPQNGSLNSTYRVMLNGRQQSELNDFIARRGNQWSERQGDPRLAGTSGKAKSEVAGGFDKKAASSAGDVAAKLELQATLAPAPLVPATTQYVKESFKEAVGRKALDEAAPSAATKPSGIPQKGVIHETAKADAEAATSRPSDVGGVGGVALRGGIDLADESREVLIVVNEQPIILPTTLPATTTATTRSSPAESVPTTVPVPAEKR